MTEPDKTIPLDQMTLGQFASWVENDFFYPLGGRERFGRTGNGSLLMDDTFRYGDKDQIPIAEVSPPPEHLLQGPPLALAPSIGLKSDRELRKKKGLPPTYKIGLNGVFSDFHQQFIGTAAAYGRLLDKPALFERYPQIKELLEEWSDVRKDSPPKVLDYVTLLQEKIASIPQIPLVFQLPDGKEHRCSIPNAPMEFLDKRAPLLQMLIALEKNARALIERPKAERDFIIKAIPDFSRILLLTDMLHDHLRDALASQAVEDPVTILKHNKLTLEPDKVRAVIKRNASFLKLSDVINDLRIGATVPRKTLETMLGWIDQRLEDTPSVANSDQARRLAEGLGNAIFSHLSEEKKRTKLEEIIGMEYGDFQKELRSIVHQHPNNPKMVFRSAPVMRLLKEAEKMRHRPWIDRALRTIEKCQAQKLAPETVRNVDRVTRGNDALVALQERYLGKALYDKRRKGQTSALLKSDATPEAIEEIMENAISLFLERLAQGGDSPNFSQCIEQARSASENAVRNASPMR